MRTVVFQSVGQSHSSWVDRCMASVRCWAMSRRLQYLEVPDEEFLALVPDWFRRKCDGHIQPVTDLARIEMARRLLRKAADRVIWVDADVLVFAPDRFDLSGYRGPAFTREVWLQSDVGSGGFFVKERVNNCVTIVDDAHSVAHYRRTCLQTARSHPGSLPKALVGTDYLTTDARSWTVSLISHVANLSPHAVRALLQDDRPVLDLYRSALGEATHAANLCASHENNRYFGTLNRAGDYEAVVDLLLTSPSILDGTGGTLAAAR